MSPARGEFAARLGLNVARARLAAGLSQEEVGFRAGHHRNRVGAVERGDAVPHADTLAHLAGAIGVHPGVFFEGIEWQPGDYAPGGFRPPARERDR